MDTDTRHEFEPLAGDDVCMYVLSNGNRCMKFEGEHAPTKIDADLAKSAAKAQELYVEYMATDGDDEEERWTFIDAALDVLEAVTGVNIENVSGKGVDST